MVRMRRYQRDLGSNRLAYHYGGPYWLWYESFGVAAAAPLAASSAAAPGPGTTNYTGSTGSKSGGAYVEDTAAVSTGPYLNTGYSRTLGLACVAYGLSYSRLTSTIDCGFAASAGFGALSMRPGVALTSSLIQLDGSTSQTAFGTTPLSTNTSYDLCVIADAIGGFSFYRVAGAPTWTLIGLTRFDTTATIFARLRFNNAAGFVQALGLAAGVLMPQKLANVAASGVQGAVTIAPTSFMAGMRLTSTATNGIKFRRVDSNNYFLAQRTNAGQLNLTRYDSGSPTSVVSSAMTAAANDRIYARLDGNTFRLSGHPTGGTWVNPSGQTLTQHTTGTAIEVLDESAYDSLEIYPLTGHTIQFPLAA